MPANLQYFSVGAIFIGWATKELLPHDRWVSWLFLVIGFGVWLYPIFKPSKSSSFKKCLGWLIKTGRENSYREETAWKSDTVNLIDMALGANEGVRYRRYFDGSGRTIPELCDYLEDIKGKTKEKHIQPSFDPSDAKQFFRK